MPEPQSPLSALIEAFLYAEGGSLSIKRLVQLTETNEASVHAALNELAQARTGSGLTIVQTDTEATLAVAPKESDALRSNYEKELGREIGDAGLEVLAIVLYRGPSTRAQIDYIRGVNTSSTIRTLLARGLLTRAGNPLDGREYIYTPTVELLAHIGAGKVQELPEYGTISNELKAFEQAEQDSGPFNHDEHERNTTENTGGADPVDSSNESRDPA
jgi:segregation and condensation protein B